MRIFDNAKFLTRVNSETLMDQYDQRAIAPDEQTQRYIDIACAIIQQTIDDWKYLVAADVDYTKYLGQWIYRIELKEFFFSEWFESLLDIALPNVTAEDVRLALKISEITDEERKYSRRAIRTSQYYPHG